MAVLTVSGSYLTFSMNYSVSYDIGTDTSTITLGEGSFRYSGANGYSTSATATITIGGSQLTYSITGTTSGGMKTFSASPSVESVHVAHTMGESLERYVMIAVNANATRYLVDPNHDYGDWVGPYYYKNKIYASGSENVRTGEMGGLVWISDGTALRPAQPYISDGLALKVAIPYMSNGTSLEVCA